MAKQQHKPWGGVFDGDVDPRVERFSESVSFDHRLFAQDIRGSIAHARMLAETGMLSAEERDQIVAGLEAIGREIAAGTFVWSIDLEVHNQRDELVGVERYTAFAWKADG